MYTCEKNTASVAHAGIPTREVESNVPTHSEMRWEIERGEEEDEERTKKSKEEGKGEEPENAA